MIHDQDYFVSAKDKTKRGKIITVCIFNQNLLCSVNYNMSFCMLSMLITKTNNMFLFPINICMFTSFYNHQ